MGSQAVFKRYELKYMLTKEQYLRIMDGIQPYMALDKYGRVTIRNLYFDTDTYILIRRSIEKPVYKEKLRIRSYARITGDDEVFVELKKKYKKVVYKRRVKMKEEGAMKWLCGNEEPEDKTQIMKEIEYFKEFYKRIEPKVFLSYEREAFYAKDGRDFRITFDENILCREDKLSLREEVSGEKLLPDGMVLMELKCPGGIPMWMTEILSKEKIYKTSFSKYGTAYRTIIFPKLKEVHKNVRETF